MATLRATSDHQMTWATPCAGWNLVDLIDHVTGGNWFTLHVLDGLDADVALARTMEQFESDSASTDKAVGSLHDQRGAFDRSGVLDQTWHHVVGDLTGRQILRLRLHDLIVHAWDCDRTLTRPVALPADLIGWGLAELADPASLTAKHFELEPAVGARAAEPLADYLVRFGRDVPLVDRGAD